MFIAVCSIELLVDPILLQTTLVRSLDKRNRSRKPCSSREVPERVVPRTTTSFHCMGFASVSGIQSHRQNYHSQRFADEDLFPPSGYSGAFGPTAGRVASLLNPSQSSAAPAVGTARPPAYLRVFPLPTGPISRIFLR